MTSAQRMKQENEKRILQVVWENPGIYRKLVAKKTNLSSQAVTNQVNELIQKNLLLEYSQKTTGKGRAPISLALNYKGIYLLTVDVSLNHMNVFLHNLYGDIVTSDHLHLTGNEDSLQCLKELIRDVLDKAGSTYIVQAVVISVAGVVKEDARIVVSAEKIHWQDMDLVTALEDLDIPVIVRNDVNFIAAYERQNYPEDVSFMIVKLDVGIGSSFVLNSSSLKTSSKVSGELGHVSIAHPETRACICGKNNCLTKFISIEALEREYGASYNRIIEDVKNGEERAIELIEQMCDYLAPVLANVINLLDIDRIILCGCTTENFSHIIYPALENKIKERLSYWVSFKGLEIHKDTDMIKAGCQVWMEHFFTSEDASLIIE